jgi:hypothetical protein
MDINAGATTDALALQTGGVDRFRINGLTDITATLPIDMLNNSLNWNTDGHSINAGATSLRLDLGVSTDDYLFQTGGVTRLTISDTIVNAGSGVAFQENGVHISPIGLHDIYVDAGAFIPVDAGILATRIVDAGADQKAFAYIPFAPSVLTFATAKIVLPRTYNLGTITVIIEWTSATEGTGTVEWDIQAAAIGEGEDMSTVTFGTAQNADDTQTTINFVQTSSRTAAITINNTPADGNVLFLKIARNGVGDTFTQEAQLLGVWVDLTTDLAVSV